MFLCAHLILYTMTISLKSFSDFRNTNILENLFDRNHSLKNSCIFFNLFSMLLLIFTPKSISIFIKSKKNWQFFNIFIFYIDNPDAPLFFIYASSIFFIELYLYKLASTVKKGLCTDNVFVRKCCLFVNGAQLGFCKYFSIY